GGFGLTPPTTGALSLFGASDASVSGNRGFNGTGAADQSNSLTGEISVTVAEVYPNGTMLVQGQKRVTLNRGDEFVQIKGIVRTADVDRDNRVESTRVADAQIAYTGKGDVARSSRREPVLMIRAILLALAALLVATPATADRIKDLGGFQGIRSNQLTGYGVVVGLPGTGDDNLEYTVQSVKAVASRFGLQLPPNANPGMKNAAVVMITAELPPFAKPGQRIDITVASMGKAKSLRGGSLVLTPLLGADGQTYAM
ncbi:hypothetical protein LTR94_029058, partial [Friedmanniomyces endolithicus]